MRHSTRMPRNSTQQIQHNLIHSSIHHLPGSIDLSEYPVHEWIDKNALQKNDKTSDDKIHENSFYRNSAHSHLQGKLHQFAN